MVQLIIFSARALSLWPIVIGLIKNIETMKNRLSFSHPFIQ
jgi:hypothetical protein